MAQRPTQAEIHPMRAKSLDHRELLELDPDTGIIRFAGQRALLLDAVAIGLMRKYLVDNFGLTAARTLLTQFGFAHGWRMAEAMQNQLQWENKEEWRLAGTRLNMLEGLFRPETDSQTPLAKQGVTILGSFEAEQHLLHFGRSDLAVCWTIDGIASGYLSRTTDEEIFVLEDRCMGKGDAACHLIGRSRKDWGEEHIEELRYFEPIRLKECLDVSLQRVMDTLKVAELKLQKRRKALVRVTQDADEPFGIIAKSLPMIRVVALARRVAKVDSTVLITGETGSGKERIAHLVHDESSRAARPFIAVNCGAITETLLESELFGHARGAFTGANQDRPGLFEAANGGTLLLDEVGDLPASMQVKLLRVLQEREVRRVGENKVRPINVRVLAATNRDLAHGVAKGTFRQDLYYRLKVVELHVPPLRERRDDILPLARVMLGEASLRMKRKITSLSPSAADQLLRYEWPGNVREIENAMERAVALARGGRVETEDLPEEVRQAFMPVATRGAVRPLEEVEKDYIIAALELNEGNQTRTADQLGIGSATLYRKLKTFGMISAKRAVQVSPLKLV